MFDDIEVYMLAHYTRGIKMHGETVKFIRHVMLVFSRVLLYQAVRK
jgi:hypothetical protein